jgi:hypothetical protein
MNCAATLLVAGFADAVSRTAMGHKDVLRLNDLFTELAGKRLL